MNPNLLFRNNKGEYIRLIYRDMAAYHCAFVKYSEDYFEYPALINIDDFLNMVNDFDQIDPNHDPALEFLKEYPEKELERIEEKYNLIKEMVDAEPYIYDKSFRNDLIKKLPGAKKTKYKYLRWFWKYGCTKFALASKYAVCGQKRSPAKSTGIPGPASSYKAKKFLMKQEDKDNIIKVYNKYLKKRKHISTFSKKRIYDNLIRTYYLGKGDLKPTENQFYHWFNILIPKKKLLIDLDPNDFNRNKRFLIGSSASEPTGPGFLYHMDATKLGICLCSSVKPDQYIGRAVLYLIIDVFSRYIVGYYLGLENESYGTGNLALLNAFSDKTSITNRFDSTRGEKWPAGKIPMKLTADKGAHYSKYADALTMYLETQVTNTAAYRPDLKGLVESIINVIQNKCYEKVSFTGVTVSLAKSHPRLLKDPRKNAYVPFDLCEEIIVRTILTYNDSVMRSYQKIDLLRINNVKSKPRDIWNYCIENGNSYGKFIPEERVRKFLLYNKTVSYSKTGVKIDSEFFIAADPSITRTLENKYYNDSKKQIQLFFNPSDFTEIYILLDNEFHRLVPRNKIHRSIYNFYEFFKNLEDDKIDYKRDKNEKYDEQAENERKLNERVNEEMEKRKKGKVKVKNVREAQENEKKSTLKKSKLPNFDSNDNDIIKKSAQ